MGPKLVREERDELQLCNSKDGDELCPEPGAYCIYWHAHAHSDLDGAVAFTLSCARHAQMARMHKREDIAMMRTWRGAADEVRSIHPPLPPLYPARRMQA